jgi:DNA-binding transcriptional ArsR family regulator
MMTANDKLALMSKRAAGDAARLLKELANENRLLVLCALADSELSVGELNERVDLSQSALSQHLARLRVRGLVRTRREGQTIYYALSESRAIDIIKLLHDEFCAAGGDAP